MNCPQTKRTGLCADVINMTTVISVLWLTKRWFKFPTNNKYFLHDNGDQTNLHIQKDVQYKALYDDFSFHVFAMMTLEHKEDTKKILFDAIDQHHDPDIYQAMLYQYEDAEPDELPSLSVDELYEAKRKMRDKITRSFSPRMGVSSINNIE
jgi:hypothetical protein